ncbi:MAG: hypothetical protein AB7U20_22750 [Planctomycetaceae bacterium]
MGDSLRKVRRGDPLQIPAETFNTFIDAARDFQNRTQNRQSTNSQELRQTGTLLVKNGSGQDRQRFEVLAIDRPIFLPSDNLWSFQDQVAVIGIVPDEEQHVGRFVVLLEPLRDGMIGRAVVSGVTPVRLNVLDEAHEWAELALFDNPPSKPHSDGMEIAVIVAAEHRSIEFIGRLEYGTKSLGQSQRVSGNPPGEDRHGICRHNLQISLSVPDMNFSTSPLAIACSIRPYQGDDRHGSISSTN